ncbi:MAG: tetratricopeptide repeat protein, partial [Bacteroidota bacterium]|nr:tetratricopeptide repeat protein [Bacteroidota bacterium]
MEGTKIGDFYHNVTARYNGYFNAREKLKEAEEKLYLAQIENFNRLLPIFIIPDDTKAKSLKTDMDVIIKKCATVIRKHPDSKWVDDCYLLIAKAHYYKRDFFAAKEAFEYVVNNFPTTGSAQSANLWIVRTLMEMGKLKEAQGQLSAINTQKDFPEELNPQKWLVEADYYIRAND